MHHRPNRKSTHDASSQFPKSTHLRLLAGLAACGAASFLPVFAEERAEETDADTHTVTVIFQNVSPPQEMIWASLCTKEQYARLGEEPCMMNGRVAAANGADLTFEDVPPGVYAVSAFHDANGNQQLDFNSRGIPDEPTGNSGDARGFFGPPRFSQMKFTLSEENAGEDYTIVITMMGNG
ncbi:MAG: DUF2141 domain-containing protein [Pseudomonadota bacterium]